MSKSDKPSERLNLLGIESICTHVANGDSLNSWCKLNGFVYNTVLDWIEADKIRSANYARAKVEREIAVFESLDEIGNDAVRAESGITIQGLRLKADNIKWKLARMNPKAYGDASKVELNVTSSITTALDEAIERTKHAG